MCVEGGPRLSICDLVSVTEIFVFFMKLGTRVLYETLLSEREFRENLFSDYPHFSYLLNNFDEVRCVKPARNSLQQLCVSRKSAQ